MGRPRRAAPADSASAAPDSAKAAPDTFEAVRPRRECGSRQREAPPDTLKAAPKRPPMPRPPSRRRPRRARTHRVGAELHRSRAHRAGQRVHGEEGDFLSRRVRMHGVPFRRMVRENRIRDVHRINRGMKVHVRGRWIVPGRIADGLVLNLAEPKIYWFADSTLAGVYAVGVGVVAGRLRPELLRRQPAGRSHLVRAAVHPGRDAGAGKK